MAATFIAPAPPAPAIPACVPLMTFAEFEQLPNPPAGHYELHHGELVTVPPPRYGHHRIQQRLVRALWAAVGDSGEASTEMGFRALPDMEYRVADVAFVYEDRHQSIPLDGYLIGAPDLVVEVLSPSNSAHEILDKEPLCMENGAKEFWIVDPVRSIVRVSPPDGRTRTYKTGQEIPLLFGGSIPVDSIFASQ